MSCLAHDKRYRSVMHSIINELRKENRTSPSALRSIPKTCCTCTDEKKDSTDAVMIKDDHQIAKLKDLIERIEREKDIDTKLILSFNRFVRFIEQNRSATVVVKQQVPIEKPKRMNSMSDLDDDDRMDTSRSRFRPAKKSINTKTSKPVTNGTFVFLPYKSDGKSSEENPDTYLTLARNMQRNGFVGRGGAALIVANKYGVKINMINRKTSESVAQALENAKKGFDRLNIHDKDQTLPLSETQPGEWVLIQPKKSSKRGKNLKMDKVVDDLIDRWGTCFRISKRPVDDDDEDSNPPEKKTRQGEDDSSSDSPSNSDSESSVDSSFE